MQLCLRSRVTIDGITATMAEHAERRGIGQGTLLSRMTRAGRHDALLLLEPATKSRKPVPAPSRQEVIRDLMRTPAGLLATAKRLGDYASLTQTSP
ncbi:MULTISPECIES: hypothetical protein [Cobetia]|uniref:hypothetical protein n=1 Tax=Cobetia TaxID=204286 RepID=UPI001115A118|nr:MULTISPECIES: hypothetical protein [Cobetia]